MPEFELFKDSTFPKFDFSEIGFYLSTYPEFSFPKVCHFLSSELDFGSEF